VGKYIDLIKQEFGSKMDLPVWRGKIHDYLGIQVNFSEDQKVKLTMYDYIEELINKTPVELMKGSGVTPAANNLFLVNPGCDKLNQVDAALYHHLTTKLLYLSKRSRPDLLLTVSFLTKRVIQPDLDDWKKLGQCLQYLLSTRHLPLCLVQTALALFDGGLMCYSPCIQTCALELPCRLVLAAHMLSPACRN
jgi:hypothetical protein